jgi:hypothetical protein
MGVAAIGLPYTVFVFISFFTSPPKYHFRIAVIFMNVSLAFVMIALYEFTEPLKISVKNKINGQAPTTISAIA